MADAFAGAGSVTGGGGFQYPIDPSIYTNLIQQGVGAINQPRPGVEGFLQTGVSSPMLQAILGPLLQSLIPGERQARQALTDEARMAGGLNSGAYATQGRMLEGELAGRRGQAVSGAMLQFLGPILQSLLGQRGQDIGAISNFASLLGAVPRPVYQPPQTGTGAGGYIEAGPRVPRGPTGGPLLQSDIDRMTATSGGGTRMGTGSGGTLNLDQILAGLVGGGGGVTNPQSWQYQDILAGGSGEVIPYGSDSYDYSYGY